MRKHQGYVVAPLDCLRGSTRVHVDGVVGCPSHRELPEPVWRGLAYLEREPSTSARDLDVLLRPVFEVDVGKCVIAIEGVGRGAQISDQVRLPSRCLNPLDSANGLPGFHLLGNAIVDRPARP